MSDQERFDKLLNKFQKVGNCSFPTHFRQLFAEFYKEGRQSVLSKIPSEATFEDLTLLVNGMYSRCPNTAHSAEVLGLRESLIGAQQEIAYLKDRIKVTECAEFEKGIPLCDWVEKYALQLNDDIECHLRNLTPCSSDEIQDVSGTIFISIRQWAEQFLAGQKSTPRLKLPSENDFERAFVREWGLPTDKVAPDDYEGTKQTAQHWFDIAISEIKRINERSK